MASEVKTNKISPATGTDVTLGDASDTFTIPSGSAITVASGGDINVLSGGEIDIASSATLDVNGTIDLTGATTTGFPAGGLTHASTWRLTSGFTGSAAPIASNLAEAALPVGCGVLGASMTESSGIFTFPTTGYWWITYNALWELSTDSRYLTGYIYTTTNNSTYAKAVEGATFSAINIAGNHFPSVCMSYLFDVTDTTQCKCRFDIEIQTGTVTTQGASTDNRTFMTFLRLADT